MKFTSVLYEKYSILEYSSYMYVRETYKQCTPGTEKYYTIKYMLKFIIEQYKIQRKLNKGF